MGRSNTIALSETTKFIVDNRGKTAPTSDEGIALIATNCIDNKNLYPVFNKVRWVDKETYANWFRSHPIPGDILLTLKGSQNGAVCLVPDPVNFAIAQDMVGLRVNKKVIDPMYLFAALRSRDVQHQIKILDVSGVIPHLKKSDFDKLILPYPDIDTQKVIGNTYYSLCQKIDLLHRQNKTLEAMAETLFRQWFVEKADDSWEEKPLSEIATFLNGLACQKYPPTNAIDKLPVLKIRELKDGFTDNSDWASTEVPEKYFVSNGDVIFSWSASLLIKIWDGSDCILNQHLFKVTSEIYPKWFYYLWSKYHLDQFIAIARAHATTMGHIKRGDLDEAMVFIPPDQILQKMDYSFDPIIEKIIANNKQLTSLTKLRDTLLPKLMSGEVRVKMN